MKNVIDYKNIRKFYNVGYAGDDRMKQIVDFVLASLLAAAMAAMTMLIIISHILGGA